MSGAGTHMGKLDVAAQERRRIKNARRDRREHPHGAIHGLDMPVAGSQRVVTTRLYREGNQQARGIGR